MRSLPIPPSSFLLPANGTDFARAIRPVTHDRLAARPHGLSILRSAALASLLALVAAACDLPRDPEGTLQRVRGGTMRVGVVERRPWTTFPRSVEHTSEL